MACNLDAIRHHNIISKQTIMPKVAISHEQIVIPNSSLLPFIGSTVNRDAFTNGVVITNDNLRRSAFVFQILRFLPQTGTRVNAIVSANAQKAIEHHVGANPGIRSDAHLRTDHSSRTDHHTPAVRLAPLLAALLGLGAGLGLVSSSVPWLSWQGYLFPLGEQAGLMDLSPAQPGVLVAFVLAALVSLVGELVTRATASSSKDLMSPSHDS